MECLVFPGKVTSSPLLMLVAFSTTLSTRLIVSQMNRFFSLASADLVVPNMEAWALLWDFETLRQLVDSVPGNTPYVVLVSCCQVHYQLTLL